MTKVTLLRGALYSYLFITHVICIAMHVVYRTTLGQELG